jgi:hypothetical protein
MKQRTDYRIRAFEPSVDNGVRPIHPFLQNQITLTHPEIRPEEHTNWVYNIYDRNALEVLMGGRRNQTVTRTSLPNGTTSLVYGAAANKIDRGGYDKEWLQATNQHRAGFIAATHSTMLY